MPNPVPFDIDRLRDKALIPIGMKLVAGERLTHDPRSRRCALSSVTSFERTADGVGWTEVAYAEPAATDSAVDVGAV